jgi:histidine triad (HIT) family protein
MLADNIFLKIIDRTLPAQVVYEDDDCLAFRDINPQAPVHVLVIPKKVIPTLDDIAEADAALVGKLHLAAAKLAKQFGLSDGYRVVINCRERAGQTVPHLHLHLLAGRRNGSLLKRLSHRALQFLRQFQLVLPHVVDFPTVIRLHKQAADIVVPHQVPLRRPDAPQHPPLAA